MDKIQTVTGPKTLLNGLVVRVCGRMVFYGVRDYYGLVHQVSRFICECWRVRYLSGLRLIHVFSITGYKSGGKHHHKKLHRREASSKPCTLLGDQIQTIGELAQSQGHPRSNLYKGYSRSRVVASVMVGAGDSYPQDFKTAGHREDSWQPLGQSKTSISGSNAKH